MSATRPPAFDDRLSTPIEASRRGAHRARPKPVSSGLPLIAGVVVVLLVIGGAYTLLSSDRTKSSSGNVSAAVGDDDQTTAPNKSPAAAGGAATSPAAVTGQASAAASPSTTPSALPSPSDASGPGSAGGRGAVVDRSVNLAVLNSITVQGLAKRVQSRLEAAGWHVSRTGNSTNRNLSTSKVYYATTSQKATATALVGDLGYGIAVKDASVASKGLVVVLGQDSR
jgi:LytR cell envelope-related transcriptional attenuator